MNISANFEATSRLSDGMPIGKTSSAGPSRTRNQGIASAPGFDGDETRLSRASSLVAQAAALSEVRSEKIAAIQQALATGAYQVSPSDVAGKLIDHMLGK
jgi:negative regulator of flagellin synthesis FlgM